MTDPLTLKLKSPLLTRLVNRTFGLEEMSRLYRQKPDGMDTQAFLQFVLDTLGVSLQVNKPENLAAIPREGPLLIVANHPLGGLEGVAIAKMLAELRPDLRVLTNQLLRRIPELAELFIGVDVLSKDAASNNVAGVKQVHSHLKQGGALLIFPAGFVSRFDISRRAIVDRPWDRLVGQLVRRYQCPCLPVHVSGRNSKAFYLAGLLHPRLGTALLPRQLLNKVGYHLPLTYGAIISPQELAAFESPRAVTEYLRISTEALASSSSLPGQAPRSGQQFAADVQRDHLQDAIDDLADCRLVDYRNFEVYCAPFERLGVIMEQIAVSREFTFRNFGQGTGQDKDSDEFDSHYLHLFLWDREASRVAGAYRIVPGR